MRIEHLYPSKHGNPLLARGTFGEVSIAVQIEENDGFRMYGRSTLDSTDSTPFVAIKTIHNAIITTNSANGTSFGGFGHSSLSSWGGFAQNSSGDGETQTEREYQLTKAAFCELAALRALSHKHPCITPLLSVLHDKPFFGSSDASSLSLVFPYHPTDLATLVHKMRYSTSRHTLRAFTDNHVRAIMKDVLQALSFCHSQGILHRDVKPGNLLLTFQGRVQLADFGLARATPSILQDRHSNDDSKDATDARISSSPAEYDHDQESQNMSHGICTLHYRPPEILFGSTSYNGTAVDIWSAGLVFAELLTLRPLFPGRNVLNQLDVIFDVLGTPCSETNWDRLEYEKGEGGMLPDYDKVHFEYRRGVGLESVVSRIASFLPAAAADGGIDEVYGCDDEGSLLLGELLQQMIALDPKRRKDANECLIHSWFWNWPLSCSSSEQLVKDFIVGNGGKGVGLDMEHFGSHNLWGCQSPSEEQLEAMKCKAGEIAAKRRNACKEVFDDEKDDLSTISQLSV